MRNARNGILGALAVMAIAVFAPGCGGDNMPTGQGPGGSNNGVVNNPDPGGTNVPAIACPAGQMQVELTLSAPPVALSSATLLLAVVEDNPAPGATVRRTANNTPGNKFDVFDSVPITATGPWPAVLSYCTPALGAFSATAYVKATVGSAQRWDAVGQWHAAADPKAVYRFALDFPSDSDAATMGNPAVRNTMVKFFDHGIADTPQYLATVFVDNGCKSPSPSDIDQAVTGAFPFSVTGRFGTTACPAMEYRWKLSATPMDYKYPIGRSDNIAGLDPTKAQFVGTLLDGNLDRSKFAEFGLLTLQK